MLSYLDLHVSEDERLIEEWNATHVPYPLEKQVHQLFTEQSHRTPDRTAVVYESEALSYRTLNAKANQLARFLVENGAAGQQSTNICGVYVDRSVEAVIALLGILKAGAAYVPIDPSNPNDRRDFIIEDAGARTILTQEHLLPDIASESIPMLVCLDSDWNRIGAHSDADLPVSDSSSDLASIIYTSGSTGKPKGVLNTHRGLTNRLLWMQQAYALETDDRVLQKTPIGFDVAGWEFFWPLITGACLVVARPGGHKDTQYLIDVIRQHAITTLHFVPPMLRAFISTDGVEECTSLQRVICSGDILTRETQEEFFDRLPRCELHNLYGPTEASIDVTAWRCAPEDPHAVVPIGKPIANTQIHILDHGLKRVPIGVPGEIFIGGVQVALGYHNRSSLTNEKFVADPFSDNLNSRLYRTGDLGVYRRDGNIEFLGRLDNQVKIRGVRVELGEIESALSTSPDVKDAVVVASAQSSGDKRLVAYIVPATAANFDANALREFLRSRLPDVMIPAYFIPLDEIPLTSNGKIDRSNLPDPRARRRATG